MRWNSHSLGVKNTSYVMVQHNVHFEPSREHPSKPVPMKFPE
jgi:hypothetical protein